MNRPVATRSIVVIINRAAGDGHEESKLAEIDAHFCAAGRAVKARLASAEEIDAAVKSALHEGAETIVIGGGDGTLSSVAGLLAGTDTALGILPMGTFNHFAKDLSIPLALSDAVRTVIDGHVAHVDVGEVNGRVFINNSSLGIYPDIVKLRERQCDRFGTRKWLAFINATWVVLRRGALMKLRIAGAGRELSQRTPFVFIGNNEYQNAGIDLGSRTSLRGGVLGLYTTSRKGLPGILRIALKALAGRLDQGEDYDTLTAAEIVIHARRHRVRMANDGEVEWMTSPLRYRSRPGALSVLVPASSTPRDA